MARRGREHLTLYNALHMIAADRVEVELDDERKVVLTREMNDWREPFSAKELRRRVTEIFVPGGVDAGDVATVYVTTVRHNVDDFLKENADDNN